MPKVSVIIPVYNVEQYLKRCLDSVVGQTLEDIEIICVNDGSTDGSLKILKEYAAKDNRIKVINQENKGAGEARNRGIELAAGEFITFVDSDDYIADNCLKQMFDAMADVDIIISDIENIANSKEEAVIKQKASFDDFYKNCALEEGIYEFDFSNALQLRTGPVAKLYKKSIIDNFNIRFPIGVINEDEAFFWYYMINVSRLYFLSKKMYKRIIHPQSIMYKLDNQNEKVLDLLIVTNEIYNFLNKRELYKKYKHSFNDYFNRCKFNILNRCGNNKTLIKKAKKEIKKYEYKFGILKPYEFIFSIKNEKRPNKKYKVLTILGIKLKLRSKNA